MSQRYTAVFEWEGEPPAIGALDEWRGGRLVRLSFDDEVARDFVVPQVEERPDTYEVEIAGQMFRTTSGRLVETIRDLRRDLQQERAGRAVDQHNAAVHRRQRAALTEDEAYAVVTKTAPWNGGTTEIVQRVVEVADNVRRARTDGGEHPPVPLEPTFTAPAPDITALEEEHRYLSSALIARCGPRKVGESWVDYARRTMGVEGGR